MDQKIKVVVVDDHPTIIDGIVRMFDNSKLINIVKGLGSVDELISFLPTSEVEVALVDIRMSGKDILEHAGMIKKRFPKLKIIAFTSYDSYKLLSKAKIAGLDGYLTKIANQQTIETAILKTSEGTYWSSLDENRKPILKENNEFDDFEIINSLTKRELEILQLIAGGKSNQDVAELLFISPLTVKTHRNKILKKLQLSNMADIVRFAIKNRIIPL